MMLLDENKMDDYVKDEMDKRDNKMIAVLDLLSDKLLALRNKMDEVQEYIDNCDEWDDEYLDSLFDEKHNLQDKYYIYNELYREIIEIIKGGD